MQNKVIFTGVLLFFMTFAQAKPKITVITNYSLDNFARIKVLNETTHRLACYVAIDGFKIKFRLQPKRASIWFKANDTRFKPSSFSYWCDYLELYPQYKKYKTY